AADVFGLEVAQQLLAVDSDRQDTVFLRLWTAGEAFVKARGLGFAGMNGGKVPVRLAGVGSEGVVLHEDFKNAWSLKLLELGGEFAGHVVVGCVQGQRAQDGSIELRMTAGLGSR